MAAVGVLLAVCVFVAILAALSAIDTLKDQRDRMMAGLPGQLQIDLISLRSRKQWRGNLPALVIPPVLFLIWAGLAAWCWYKIQTTLKRLLRVTEVEAVGGASRAFHPVLNDQP